MLFIFGIYEKLIILINQANILKKKINCIINDLVNKYVCIYVLFMLWIKYPLNKCTQDWLFWYV